MKKLLLFLFILSSFCAFSQNWSIINSNERYHYKTRGADFYTNTVQVDSIKLEGLDSIFYLNTICKPCDTCSILGTYIAYQEQCFNKIVRKSANGNYAFYLPDTFFIHSTAIIGDTWIYKINAFDTIFASVSNIDSASVLGIPDSVKTILLSNNDTLLLSKNHGMLQMVEQSDTETFELIGLQTQHIGFTLPTWREIYDFNVGDSLFYEFSEYWSGGIDHSSDGTTYTKIYILSKMITDSTIVYSTYRVFNHINYDGWVSGGGGYGEQIFNANILYSSHYDEELYNNQYIPQANNIRLVELYQSRTKITYKSYDDYDSSRLGPNLFLFPGDGCYHTADEYVSGLGLTDYERDGCLSMAIRKILVCYNDTGINESPDISCEDFYDITSISSSKTEHLKITYNQYQINLENFAAYPITYLLFDNQGRTIISGNSREVNIQIDISTLSHGMYYLKTSVAAATSTYKILK